MLMVGALGRSMGNGLEKTTVAVGDALSHYSARTSSFGATCQAAVASRQCGAVYGTCRRRAHGLVMLFARLSSLRAEHIVSFHYCISHGSVPDPTRPLEFEHPDIYCLGQFARTFVRGL